MFLPWKKLLNGNEMTFGDPDYWCIFNRDGVVHRQGKLILVKTGSGLIFLIDYD